MPEQELKYFVRIANTDLEGKKPIASALRKIKGVSFMFASAVCSIADVERAKKTGYLTDQEAERMNDIIKNPAKYNIPSWMFNRRKDYDTGADRHLITSDLDFTKENDIKIQKKIKSYRGVRHMSGLPVRGQKTKSNFRRNKGKVTGVKKKKIRSGRV